MREYDKFYIDGAWVEPDGTGTIDVINASTEEVMGSIPEGTATDIDRAVAAAKAGVQARGHNSKEERGKDLQGGGEGLPRVPQQ